MDNGFNDEKWPINQKKPYINWTNFLELRIKRKRDNRIKETGNNQEYPLSSDTKIPEVK